MTTITPRPPTDPPPVAGLPTGCPAATRPADRAAALAVLDGVSLPSGAAGRLGVGPHLRVRRAWPRGGVGRLDLEMVDDRGTRLAGRWIADDAERVRLAEAVGAAGCPDDVARLDEVGLMLQARGADERLPALSAQVARPSASLIAHRPARRAVLADHDAADAPVIHKLVRPSRLPDVVRTGALAATCRGIGAPALLAVDQTSGASTWARLPGRPLAELLDQPSAVAHMAVVGTALRALAQADPPGDLPAHGPEEEIAHVWTWLTHLTTLDPALAASLTPVASRLAEDPPHPPRTWLLHRDLHDGQVLVDDDGDVGLIDLDTLSTGDRALDVGNLLAHLDLEVATGRLDHADATVLGEALQRGARLATADLRRVAWYRQTTRVRLCAVHAFRPAQRAAVDALARQVRGCAP